ncbi:MAG TPA: prepilin-type N-terminal cleavage/methylation domain-containing protein [Nitrospirae bacterium]|nr:prepilin-type N-terminal cleavage/methylation domain-containing protein [Nitrospirota bacterium]
MLKPRGFSLFEVLIAMSILSISVVLILQLFSMGLRSTKKAEDYTTALVIARSLMNEALSAGSIEDAGMEEEYEGGYSAERTIEEVSQDEEGATRLYRITVIVRWPPSGRLKLTSMRAVHEENR